MTILVAAAMMYMKSKSIVDIGYFCVVFVLFIKFLIVKLYHVWYNFFGDFICI